MHEGKQEEQEVDSAGFHSIFHGLRVENSMYTVAGPMTIFLSWRGAETLSRVGVHVHI